MKIGDVLRYPRPAQADVPVVNDLPNFFFATATPGERMAQLEKGINPIAAVTAVDGSRRPAILISSSPHHAGSASTPWLDHFDPDVGRIRYFGDNKTPAQAPYLAPGNKALLAEYNLHCSKDRDERAHAAPILFFKRVRVGGRTKGNVQFQGLGVINRVELVTQHDSASGAAFTNFSFDFTVLDLAAEHEVFTWDWISMRRMASNDTNACLSAAPKSWRDWVKHGNDRLSVVKRHVVKHQTVSTANQRASEGSAEQKTLQTIYAFYDGRKARFEALAAFVAEKVLGENCDYKPGWITAASSDGGADFVGRLDIGSGFGRARLVVLGQAKCEKLSSPTGGNHIARTVARLRRGWVGVYITTSYFSEPVQQEVLEDAYPIVLINGVRVAEVVNHSVHDQGLADVKALLEAIDAEYESLLADRDPEEILID